jgi:hypothetical protein
MSARRAADGPRCPHSRVGWRGPCLAHQRGPLAFPDRLRICLRWIGYDPVWEGRHDAGRGEDMVLSLILSELAGGVWSLLIEPASPDVTLGSSSSTGRSRGPSIV